MINNILDNINIEKEKYLLVGTSTGPDSMALLHYLLYNTNKQIICCHINHNVREESKIEEEYLKNFCKKNNIIFESTIIKKYNENNFENEARKKRYKFYQEIINKYHAKYLFLAHHGDDLIETIMMKIIRGSNLEGYAGIKRISEKNNYYIVRPLLKYTKEDLINYNKLHNITYFTDNSNYDIKYTRNRLRHKLLPILKEENPNIHTYFLNFSETLLEYNEYINKEIKKIIPGIFINNKLLLDKFINLDPFIQKNILYYILNNYYQNKDNIITEKHIKSIFKIINNNKPNLIINLPNNNICIKEYNYLYIKKNTIQSNYKIEMKKEIIINNHIIKRIDNSKDDGNNICRLNSKKIKLPLYIRNRKNGDYIELKGTNGKKKIKDIFIDKKIPLSIRNNYPILVDSNDNILWIPNIKKSKFNIQKDKFCDIILKYCEKEENNE
ncbi:MAG: tRNA lysidine(34) synthetase TilS [Bacilli bacterium]|nr:tRNA lysidine(34) synthetase TilS [Bacilli bacterium]